MATFCYTCFKMYFLYWGKWHSFPFYLVFLIKAVVVWSIVTSNIFEFSHYCKILSCQDVIYISKWLLGHLYFRISVTCLNFSLHGSVSVCVYSETKKELTYILEAVGIWSCPVRQIQQLQHMKPMQLPGRGDKSLGYQLSAVCNYLEGETRA